MFPESFPIISTDNLLLREHQQRDIKEYFALMSTPLAVRYFGRPVMNSIDQVTDEFENIKHGFDNKNFIKWAITTKSDGKYIGSIGAWDFKNNHSRVTLSCIITPDFWGLNLGYEALTSVIHYLFNEIRLHRLQIYVDPINERGLNFFKKIGFQQEGVLKDYEYEYGHYIDIVILSMINKRV